jgi:hypothetical protein
MFLATKTMAKSSATLTRCSIRSEPSKPKYVDHFPRKRAHTSVCDTRQLVPVVMTMTESSMILTHCSTKSGPSRAYFAPKRRHNRQSVPGKKAMSSRQRYVRATAPRVCHPGQNRRRISRQREGTIRVVSQSAPVAMTMTESSAIHTYCSTKNDPSGTEEAASHQREGTIVSWSPWQRL